MIYEKLKSSLTASKYLLFIFLAGYLFVVSCKPQAKPMKIVSDDAMVQIFYAKNDSNQFWFSSNKNMKRANEWLDVIDSAYRFGLVSDKVQIEQARMALANNSNIGIEIKEAADQQITSLVLNFIQELQEGIVTF